MFDFFIKTVVDEYGDTTYLPTTAGYVALILIVAAILVIAVALSNKKKKTVDTKQLVFCAVAMGLATVTSFMKVYSFPFGGSITLLSMFFICQITSTGTLASRAASTSAWPGSDTLGMPASEAKARVSPASRRSTRPAAVSYTHLFGRLPASSPAR